MATVRPRRPSRKRRQRSRRCARLADPTTRTPGSRRHPVERVQAGKPALRPAGATWRSTAESTGLEAAVGRAAATITHRQVVGTTRHAGADSRRGPRAGRDVGCSPFRRHQLSLGHGDPPPGRQSPGAGLLVPVCWVPVCWCQSPGAGLSGCDMAALVARAQFDQFGTWADNLSARGRGDGKAATRRLGPRAPASPGRLAPSGLHFGSAGHGLASPGCRGAGGAQDAS